MLELDIHYDTIEGYHKGIRVQIELRKKTMFEPHKYTFLHPGGFVSYAMIRPPSNNGSGKSTSNVTCTLPILLNLHGAGLKADDPQLTSSLDAISGLPAWTIFPAGVTPWSGDDWHQWGWADVEAAIAAIPAWIESVRWKGPQPNFQKWLVAGHSNGGQGVWYALTHRPDSIIAAAPISGYLSIQSYVPFQMWREVDPRLIGIIQAASSGFQHEILVSNTKGIPIFQEHGGADDNVSPYHSRRMNQLISETGWTSEYYEIPGQSHWFDGIMTTAPLQDFYEKHLRKTTTDDLHNFTLTVANIGDTHSKGGVSIGQVFIPGQLAKVKVVQTNKALLLNTSNVQQLIFTRLTPAVAVIIDGQALNLPLGRRSAMHTCERNPRGIWRVGDDS